MNNEVFKDLHAGILSDPQLRELYYQERKRGRADRLEREAIEQAAEDGHQRQLLREARRNELKQLLSLSPAEAWMSQHEELIDSESAPTRGGLQLLVIRERLRLKATRQRLRELGVK